MWSSSPAGSTMSTTRTTRSCSGSGASTRTPPGPRASAPARSSWPGRHPRRLEATATGRYDRLRDARRLPDGARVVEHGKVMTGAGVSAGIDIALVLLGRLFGDDIARAVQLAIEYDPQPPYDSGSPAKASPDAIAPWAPSSRPPCRRPAERRTTGPPSAGVRGWIARPCAGGEPERPRARRVPAGGPSVDDQLVNLGRGDPGLVRTDPVVGPGEAHLGDQHTRAVFRGRLDGHGQRRPPQSLGVRRTMTHTPPIRDAVHDQRPAALAWNGHIVRLRRSCIPT